MLENLDISKINEYLRYDDYSGKFYILKPTRRADVEGRELGYKFKDGVKLSILGKQYPADKVAIYLRTGKVPYAVIHLNMDTQDNRINNLFPIFKDDLEPPHSPELLRALFQYDPFTGVLRNRLGRGGAAIGSIAGAKAVNGYIAVSVFKKKYFAHRVIWAVRYGTWPEDEIDHINTVRDDNRLVNLRCATQVQNSHNTGARKHSLTGIKGVSVIPETGRYRVRVRSEGKVYNVGCYESESRAALAAQTARKKLHGEFCRN